jgi:tetratricopeptide (TPR) repeat protein
VKHIKLTKLLVLIPLIMLVLPGSGCKRKTIEQLLQRGKVEAAEKRCEKIKPEEKTDCYKTIALFYLKNEQYKKAAMYYAKAGAHINVINSYFQGDLITEAEKYCAEQTGEVKKQCAASLGRKFFIDENPGKAIQYYHLAGETEKVLYIEAMTPIFQLVDQINKKAAEAKDFDLSGKITGLKKALVAYIYMEKYHKWPYPKEPGPYQTAASIFEDALKILEDNVVPTFIKTLNDRSFDWSEKSVRSLSFDQFKMESLINLIIHLHHIADKKEFFTKYSVIYQDKSKREKKEPPQSINYEEAYMKVLDHSKMLLEEIAESNGEKNKEQLDDYQHDINIDMQIIDYIASMMDNVKSRIDDIHQRSQKLKNSSKDEAVKEKAEKLFWDFAARCSRVLHLISKEKYQEANDLIISAYDTAKSGIDRYAGKPVGQ